MHWNGLHRVTEVLMHSKYIIWLILTHKTQGFRRVHLRPFELQQRVEDITVNDAEIYPDPDAKDDAYSINNNISRQVTTEVDENQPQLKLKNTEAKNQTVHTTDNEVISMQLPTTQINVQTTNQPIRPHHQNNNETPNTAIDPPTNKIQTTTRFHCLNKHDSEA